MWLLASLVAYAVLLATVAGRRLADSRWPARAPVLGVVLWQVITVSLFVTVMSIAAVLALPDAELGDGLAAFLRTCAHTLRERYATPGGAVAATTGLLLAVAVVGRLGWCIGAELWRCRQGRRSQLERLRIAADRHPGLGAYVVDDERAVAFCVPGRAPAVVLTSATVRALTGVELAAVLAHEAAHLRWRHDLPLAVARASAQAFPFVPSLRLAHQHIGELVEMAADDVAARRHGTRAVGSALVQLASAEPPQFSLGASGSGSAVRARRMLTSDSGLRHGTRGALMFLAVNAAVAPLLVTVGPAVTAAATQHCPFVV
ncbi:MAG: M56 family metallopeptidase [Actinomycetes bacterium]